MTPRHPALRRATPDELLQVAERVRPVALAHEQGLPVLPALADLVPGGALRRGSTVGVAGRGGATSLALALTAGPSAAGSWAVAVGFPGLGLAAAAELGVVLERMAVVAPPEPSTWSTVVATLVDAFDVVLVRPPARVRSSDVRRLAARTRERGAVLVQVGEAPLPADLRFTVTGVEWHGLGVGHGHLAARQVEVAVDGRRQAARPLRARLWLVDPEGRVAPVASAPSPRVIPGGDRRDPTDEPGEHDRPATAASAVA